MQSSIWTRRPLFGPKCANANDIFGAKRKGALALPKGSLLKIHFPFCVTKAGLSCSDSATGIWW